MFTVSWSHSQRVQCGAPFAADLSSEIWPPPENHARAFRYFSELNGSLPLPSKLANTRFVSGRGPPQHGMILPFASITMFLYSQ